LHSEADHHFLRAVENLEHAIAHQAVILACGRFAGSDFKAAVAGLALGADDA
jgi:hypothetical protein